MKNIRFEITETNCHIFDSYKIQYKKEMRDFLKQILPSCFFKTRSLNSYVREWAAHNLLYKWHIEKERTKSVDLNIDEKLSKRIGYFFLSLIY